MGNMDFIFIRRFLSPASAPVVAEECLRSK